MTIWVHGQAFPPPFASVNGSRLLPVGVADIVRAAVTVGGPVEGSAWGKSLRRAGITALIHSALTGSHRSTPLGTTRLYEQLETTEKSGVSFRLGMAFAAVSCEHLLNIGALDHLNCANSRLASGSKRRADLFGIDHRGHWHVVEAKSRTYGATPDVIAKAKAQAINIRTILKGGRELTPVTRSASIASLARPPISVLLIDPEPKPAPNAVYEVDIEEFLAHHFSAVPDLLEAQGGPQPAPVGTPPETVGAHLPGTEFWLGIHRSLLAASGRSWADLAADPWQDAADAERSSWLSVGRDGHVLHLGSRLAERHGSWRENRLERDGEIDGGTA